MAAGKLHRISAECQPQQLMTETDPKDGKRAVRQSAQRLDGVIDGGRVAGPVREEQAIGFELTHAGRGCGGRYGGDAAPMTEEEPDDVALHPVVVRDDVGGRSEERRVGEECRSRWAACHLKKKKEMECICV